MIDLKISQWDWAGDIFKKNYHETLAIWEDKIEWIQSIDEDFHCIIEQLFCESEIYFSDN